MKKAFVLLTLIAATATMAVAQQKALPGKYAGSNTLTLFDSTGVYMEESGLSHILNHKCIEMYSFAGCAAYSTYKIDYDPLSAYCEIERVLVHRTTGKTDTLLWPGRDGNITVYDYVASPTGSRPITRSQRNVKTTPISKRGNEYLRTNRAIISLPFL